MKKDRYIYEVSNRAPILGTIGLINATVFYVALKVFARGDVVTYTPNGRATISSNLLMLKLGALAGFLLVSMIGLYITLELLSESDPNDRLKKDKERYLSWKAEYQRRQIPRPATQSSSNEQIDIEEED